MNIEIDDGAINARFAELLAAGENPRPYLATIGEALRTSTYLRFRSGGPAPDGKAWTPLSPVTLALRRRGRGSGSARPLWSTGVLANSIHASVDAKSVTVGTNIVYGRMQHFGARRGEFGRYSQVGRVRKFGLGTFQGSSGTKIGFPIPWGNVPGRPFLGLSRDDRSEIIGILRKAILGQ